MKMFVVASSFVVVLLSVMLTTAHAFFEAPVPGFVEGLSIYDADGSKRVLLGSENNEVPMIDAAVDNSSSSRSSGTNEDDDDDDDDDESDEQPADEPEVRGDERTFFMMDFESPREKENKDRNKGEKEDDSENQSPLDPWSIVWYIGSFGGLVAFFLIVSCSEWCCRRSARPASNPYGQRGTGGGGDHVAGVAGITETPPPPYHLFAPPPYDSVNYGELVDKASGEKIDIFVISVPVPGTTRQPAPT